MSELIYRDNIARRLDITDLQLCFDQYLKELDKGKTISNNFDSRSLKPEIMIKPKAEYIAEIIKQISSTYNLIVGVVELEIIYDIEEAWSQLKKEPKNLKDLLTIPNDTEPCSIVEYIEKHVLLDLMLGPFLQENFVSLGLFPYSCHGMIGVEDGFYDSVKDAWAYHYQNHSNRLGTLINTLVSASLASGKKLKTKRSPQKTQVINNATFRRTDDFKD